MCSWSLRYQRIRWWFLCHWFVIFLLADHTDPWNRSILYEWNAQIEGHSGPADCWSQEGKLIRIYWQIIHVKIIIFLQIMAFLHSEEINWFTMNALDPWQIFVRFLYTFWQFLKNFKLIFVIFIKTFQAPTPYADQFVYQCKGVLEDTHLLRRLREERFDVMIAENFDMCGIGGFYLFINYFVFQKRCTGSWGK